MWHSGIHLFVGVPVIQPPGAKCPACPCHVCVQALNMLTRAKDPSKSFIDYYAKLAEYYLDMIDSNTKRVRLTADTATTRKITAELEQQYPKDAEGEHLKHGANLLCAGRLLHVHLTNHALQMVVPCMCWCLVPPSCMSTSTCSH
jgi:hypothetical protein